MRWLLPLLLAVPLSAQTPDSVRTFRSEHLDSVKTWYTVTRRDTLWRTLADSVVVVDTTKPIPPSALKGVPLGAYYYPIDSLGKGSYTSTLLNASSDMRPTLDRLRAAKAHAVIQYPRSGVQKNGVWNAGQAKLFVAGLPDLGPYIADGTIVGFIVADDITSTSTTNGWGPGAPTRSRVDSMALPVATRWPQLCTFARAQATQLAGYSYKWLCGAWAQYKASYGNVTTFVATELASATASHLCLTTGWNLLNGGDGSSKIPGTLAGKWQMSGAELLKYGPVLAPQSVALLGWRWDATRKADKVALAALRPILDGIPRKVCR